MKRHLAVLSATALALCGSPLWAQSPTGGAGGAGGGPGRRMEALFAGITLTADQQAKIDSIQKHYREQMPSFTPGSPPDSATRERIRGLFRHEIDDFRGVLTPDQQPVFDKNVAAIRQRRGGGP